MNWAIFLMVVGNEGAIIGSIDTSQRYETFQACQEGLNRASWSLIPFDDNLTSTEVNNARCITRPGGWD